jgi:hypothetical protein
LQSITVHIYLTTCNSYLQCPPPSLMEMTRQGIKIESRLELQRFYILPLTCSFDGHSEESIWPKDSLDFWEHHGNPWSQETSYFGVCLVSNDFIFILTCIWAKNRIPVYNIFFTISKILSLRTLVLILPWKWILCYYEFIYIILYVSIWNTCVLSSYNMNINSSLFDN